MNTIKDLVDLEKGEQSRRLFADKEIYELEQERVFGRCWLFLVHESQIPETGDFFSTYMGEDQVLVVRQRDGSIKAFLNTCTHRGNRVCFAESGRVRSFTCNYHGWSFALDGALTGVPLEKECYQGRLDKSKLGLTPVARVESYAGFVFGCLDADAPPLAEYLGEMAWYMDTFTSTGGVELLGPPLKSVLRCNWKVPAENFICDVYHVGWTHASALKVLGGPLGGLAGSARIPGSGIEITTRHGHGFGAIWEAAAAIHRHPDLWNYLKERQPEVARKLGEWRGKLYLAHWDATIFPNCSFLYATNCFKVWHPKGPSETEIWTWTMVEKDMPLDLKRKVQKETLRTFGIAGTLESGDIQNFLGCTAANRGRATRVGRINGSMGLGTEAPHEGLPGLIAPTNFSEASERGFYRFWAETMQARNWAEISSNDQHWQEGCSNGSGHKREPASVN
jgi:phenylpropionate dioxygenase-like ring-hydroxylating dioxygenase large terminal subunit